MASVAIKRGLHGGEEAATVPKDQWRDLVRVREMHCNRSLREDCRALVFYIEDAAKNDWLGFGDRDAYVREGLGLDPELVTWAVDGLRRLDGDKAVTFDAAVVMGVKARELRGQGKSLRAIGKALGVSHQTVRDTLTPDTRKRGQQVRLHPDPVRAAGTVITARGLTYAKDLAAAIMAWESA